MHVTQCSISKQETEKLKYLNVTQHRNNVNTDNTCMSSIVSFASTACTWLLCYVEKRRKQKCQSSRHARNFSMQQKTSKPIK